MNAGRTIAGPIGRLRRLRGWAAATTGVAVVMGLLGVWSVVPASAAAAGWPMFQEGPQHPGQAAAAGPSSPTAAWTYTPPSGYAPVGSPPIAGGDGTVYVASFNRSGNPSCAGVGSAVVDAVSPQGGLLWEWPDSCAGTFRSGLAVGPDGTVYFLDGFTLTAIAPGGATRWQLPLSARSEGEVTIGPDSTLYVQDASSTVYAVNPVTGNVQWTYSAPSGSVGVRGTVALSPDGSTVYVGSGGGVLSALTTSGTLKWTFPITGPDSGNIENAPAVGPDGTIYIATGGTSGSTPSDIDAVNPDGTLKWKYTADGTFETTPAVGNDGLVVAGDDAGTVVALHAADGSLAWTFTSPGSAGSNGFSNSSALIDTRGTAYLQNQYGVFAIGANGTTQWTASQLGGYGSSFALDPTAGQLYLVTSSALVALPNRTPTTTTLASSADPSNVGQAVTYTAKVSPAPDGGAVAFTDGGSPITGCGKQALSSGTATCTVIYKARGSHSIVASYSGDANFTASTSPALGQTVANCGTSLSGCNLSGANLANANLSGRNLTGANLSNANLTGANLSNANLSGANLSNANLSGANLTEANLKGANLKGANLAKANLTGATLTGATLSGVSWSNTICPDGTNSNNDGGTCLGHL